MLETLKNPEWPFALDFDAFNCYREHARRELARVTRNLNGLSSDDVAELTRKPPEQIRVMEEAVAANNEFLDAVRNVMKRAVEQASEAEKKAAAAPRKQPVVTSKHVQNLLNSFVREWSEEGLEERNECFQLLLDSMHAHLGAHLNQGSQAQRVLCPTSALGRLPYEVARLGYVAEGCEPRPLYFMASEFVGRQCLQKAAYRPQPYVLNTCNRFKAEDNVRVTAIPDVPVESWPVIRYGDFAQLYDDAAVKDSFDALLTAYALDTSPNILRFVRTAAHVVKPGGFWANFGPLAYDAEHDEGSGHGIELSWEELHYAISQFFELKEERFIDAYNGANSRSMMVLQYSCVYFTAVRTNTPSPGIGEKGDAKK